MQYHIHEINKNNKQLTKELLEEYKEKFSSLIEELNVIDDNTFISKIEEGLCDNITVEQFVEFAGETAESLTLHIIPMENLVLGF